MIVAQLDNVFMRYGLVQALGGVSFDLREGEVVAVLGPNGAGKTTAISLLTGLKRVQKGAATLFGMDPSNPAARKNIGVTPQESAFPHAQKVFELLDFARSHYPAPSSTAEIAAAFGLTDILGQTANTMSGGQQRKLAIALAFCGNPKLVILDEPTTGVDTASRQRIWQHISAYKRRGGSVLLTTHYLEEAECIADRVILMNNGIVAQVGTVNAIKNLVGMRTISFVARYKPDITSAIWKESKADRHFYITADADMAVRELVDKKIMFSEIEILPASLEMAVVQVLGEAA